MECTVHKKRDIFLFIRYLSICFLWIGVGIRVQAQTLEKKADEMKLTEKGALVRSEDVGNARIKAEEVRANADKLIHEIESFVLTLERDAETTATYLEKLQQEIKVYRDRGVNSKFLELLDKELSVTKEKIEVGREQIETYHDRIAAIQNQSKVYNDRVALLESAMKLNEILDSMPHDQAPHIKKEADIAKGYITTAQASIKERETVVSFFIQELEEVKVRVSGKQQDLAKYLESLKAEIKDTELIKDVQEKTNSIMLWKKAVNAQWITIFQTRLETAKTRYDQALQALKNAEFNVVLLTEKANRLEEKLKNEELKKKQAELEVAKKVEEVDQKIAELKRAEAEKALQEATRRADEVVQKQMMTTSPEKKRVLELEAELHKQTGIVAIKKDELLTVGSQRYKDATEYKRLETDIGFFLNRGAITSEIDEFLKKIDSEIKRFSDAVTVIESLIASVKQEEKLFSDNLKNTQEEISRIEKEFAAFENKELFRVAKEYVRQKIEVHEEQLRLTSTRLDRLNERLDIKNNALALLNSTREKLLTIRAANIWSRSESDISTETLRAIYKDLVNCYAQIDQLQNMVQGATKNFIAYLSIQKKAISFWAKLCVVLVLLAGFYFSRRFMRWWCPSEIEEYYVAADMKDGSDIISAGEEVIHKIEESHETTDESYYKSRLLPSLFIVMKKSFNAFWIAILSFFLASIFSIKVPWVTAATCILIFFAVYKILKGFLVESFGPEKGDKKLVTSLAYVSPKHLYRSLNIILLFSLISLSIITVLTSFGYKNDVIKLLWFIYRLGILILLVWLATQKTSILKLLPSGESKLGKLIHRIIRILYPVFVIFIISLFAIRNLGYSVLAYALLKTCIKSFVIVFVAFWIWKYLYHRLNYTRAENLKRKDIKRGTPEEKKFQTITTIYSVSFNYAISIITAIVIIRVWVRSFYDALSSPASPYLVQKIFSQMSTILGAISSGLRYRFIFDDGKYTTPVKIIISLIVLLVSFLISQYVKRLLEERVFYKFRIERGARQTLSSIARYIIIGIAALIGLNLAGIPLKSLTIFAGAFGIGVGFGMQNLIGNFVSGIILLIERPMRVGDVVTLEDGTLGTIERINARSTTMITPDEIMITVPNSKFIESRITNWTLPTSRMRGCVKVGVAYGSDTVLVKKCLLDIAKKNSHVRAYPEPFVRFAEFGDSALKFELYFWADDPGKRWFTMSELNYAIDEVFRKNNIEIAFPQRDIHIRSVVPLPVQNTQEYSK